MELPPDFPHQPPKGFSYEVRQFKRNCISIWICNHGIFSYTSETPKSIWGFFNGKKGEYYAPINATKCGNKVNVENTTPYTAMQLNLNPLEAQLFR
jgi:hypothetical protein